MQLNLLHILGGAADQAVKSIEQEEKDARVIAANQVKNLYENYMALKNDNTELENKLKNNLSIVKSAYGTDLSEAQLVDLAKNPMAVKVITDGISAGTFKKEFITPAVLSDITSNNPTSRGAADSISDMLKIPPMAAAAVSMYQSKGLFSAAGDNAARKTAERTAAQYGIPLEQLQGAVGYKRPTLESKATVNLEAMQGPKTFDKMKDEAMRELLAAQQSKDDTKITIAVEKATQVRLTEDLFSAAGKRTEADIRSDLANKIIIAGKKGNDKEVSLLKSELEYRKALLDKEEKDPNKITAANYMTAARNALASAIMDKVPKEAFNVVENPDGSQRVELKTFTHQKKYEEGVNIGRAAVVKEMTNAEGMPKTEMHKLAMLNIGISFDASGKAIATPYTIPTATNTPTPAPSGSSAAPRAGTATPAAAPAAAPAPTGARAVTGKVGEPAAPVAAPATAAARPPVAPTKQVTMAEVNAYLANKNKNLPPDKQLTAAQVIADLKKNDYSVVD
jgi:hypothetical protein